jgi:Immunity protein 35
VNVDQAKQLAELFISSKIVAPRGDRFIVVDAGRKEDAGGWYFPYQTEGFLTTRNLDLSVVGNWPVFVSKDGRTVELRRPPMTTTTSSSAG